MRDSLLVQVVLTGLGVLFLVGGGALIRSNLDYALRGVRTEATITGVEMKVIGTTVSRYNPGRPIKQRVISYFFTDEAGNLQRGELHHNLPNETVGSTFPLEYLRDAPDIRRVPLTQPIAFWGTVVFLIAVGLPTTILAGWNTVRLLRKPVPNGR